MALCVVMSLPRKNVLRHIVKECASEWYQLAGELGYSQAQVGAMTHDIPSPGGKLQAVIDRKTRKHGKRRVLEAVLDACYEVMPLALGNAMEDLGISSYKGRGKFFLLCVS